MRRPPSRGTATRIAFAARTWSGAAASASTEMAADGSECVLSDIPGPRQRARENGILTHDLRPRVRARRPPRVRLDARQHHGRLPVQRPDAHARRACSRTRTSTCCDAGGDASAADVPARTKSSRPSFMADGRADLHRREARDRVPPARGPAPEPRRRRLPSALRATTERRLRARRPRSSSCRTATSRSSPRRSMSTDGARRHRDREPVDRARPGRSRSRGPLLHLVARLPRAGRVRRAVRRVPLAGAAPERSSARLVRHRAPRASRAERSTSRLCELDANSGAHASLSAAWQGARTSTPSRSTPARTTACSLHAIDEAERRTRRSSPERERRRGPRAGLPAARDAPLREHAHRPSDRSRRSVASTCYEDDRRRPPARQTSTRTTRSGRSIVTSSGVAGHAVDADGSARIRVNGGAPLLLRATDGGGNARMFDGRACSRER